MLASAFFTAFFTAVSFLYLRLSYSWGLRITFQMFLPRQPHLIRGGELCFERTIDFYRDPNTSKRGQFHYRLRGFWKTSNGPGISGAGESSLKSSPYLLTTHDPSVAVYQTIPITFILYQNCLLIVSLFQMHLKENVYMLLLCRL